MWRYGNERYPVYDMAMAMPFILPMATSWPGELSPDSVCHCGHACIPICVHMGTVFEWLLCCLPARVLAPALTPHSEALYMMASTS